LAESTVVEGAATIRQGYLASDRIHCGRDFKTGLLFLSSPSDA
jgi:hypothetical protein